MRVQNAFQMIKEMKDSDLPMVWVRGELEDAAEKAPVIKINDDAWDKYICLAEKTSYVSRRSTLKDKLMHVVGDIVECVYSPERGPSQRHTILIPKNYDSLALSQLTSQACVTDENELLPVYRRPNEDIFLSLVHVAFKIREDLRKKPGYKGLIISAEDSNDCVPESLQLFLHVLFGGERLLDGETIEEKGAELHSKAFSIAQNIVYGVSNGRKWSPKHIGLGCTLHQVTRYKNLVKLFHKAGYIHSVTSRSSG